VQIRIFKRHFLAADTQNQYNNDNNNNNNVYFKSLSYTNVLFKLEMKAQTK